MHPCCAQGQHREAKERIPTVSSDGGAAGRGRDVFNPALESKHRNKRQRQDDFGALPRPVFVSGKRGHPKRNGHADEHQTVTGHHGGQPIEQRCVRPQPRRKMRPRSGIEGSDEASTEGPCPTDDRQPSTKVVQPPVAHRSRPSPRQKTEHEHHEGDLWRALHAQHGAGAPLQSAARREGLNPNARRRNRLRWSGGRRPRVKIWPPRRLLVSPPPSGPTSMHG